jgi:uroporphyrinogen-III synthase
MSDLSDLADVYYDILAFLVQLNQVIIQKLPEFKTKQNSRFGSTTQKRSYNGLRIDILAPSPNAPSMTMALEKYILANKGK